MRLQNKHPLLVLLILFIGLGGLLTACNGDDEKSEDESSVLLFEVKLPSGLKRLEETPTTLLAATTDDLNVALGWQADDALVPDGQYLIRIEVIDTTADIIAFADESRAAVRSVSGVSQIFELVRLREVNRNPVATFTTLGDTADTIYYFYKITEEKSFRLIVKTAPGESSTFGQLIYPRLLESLKLK